MKAYYAWVENVCPTEGVDVIFANNAKEAKIVAYKKGRIVNEYLEHFFDIRIRRCPNADWWANLAGRPGVWQEFFFNDPCFLRDAFGSIEDLPQAESCGCIDASELHPDPEARKILHKRWKICPVCEFCAECGHSSSCPNNHKEINSD